MKALIFDIDGTLWDSRAIVARGYNDYLLEIGRPDLQVDAEYLKTLFGKTMTEIADIMLSSIEVPERYDVMLGDRKSAGGCSSSFSAKSQYSR